MISHALTIVVNELTKHFADTYNSVNNLVGLGNLAEGLATETGNNGVPRNMLCLSMVNMTKEKTLQNLPNHL